MKAQLVGLPKLQKHWLSQKKKKKKTSKALTFFYVHVKLTYCDLWILFLFDLYAFGVYHIFIWCKLRVLKLDTIHESNTAVTTQHKFSKL